MKTLGEQASANVSSKNPNMDSEQNNKEIIKRNVLNASSKRLKYVSLGSLHLSGDLAGVKFMGYKSSIIPYAAIIKLQSWLVTEGVSLYIREKSESIFSVSRIVENVTRVPKFMDGEWAAFTLCSFRNGYGIPVSDIRIGGW